MPWITMVLDLADPKSLSVIDSNNSERILAANRRALFRNIFQLLRVRPGGRRVITTASRQIDCQAKRMSTMLSD
jgi:hypothetical protein